MLLFVKSRNLNLQALASLTDSIKGRSQMPKRITFEVSNELHQRLKLLCYAEDLSIGEILRQCVSDYCEKNGAHLIELIDNRKKEDQT